MARINSKQAKEMNEAYAKIYQNFQERFDPSKYDLSKPQGGLSNKEYAALSNSEIRGLERASSDYLRKNPDAYTTIKTKDGKTLKKGDDGFEQELSKARDTLRTANDKSLGRGSSNNNQSNNNNNQTTQQKPATQQQQQQKPATQQQQQQRPVATTTTAARPGALGRLGSLAGRAANAARNAAGGIKQVATSAASNIKKGAQAVAGGIRQGTQAVSGALANKGPIQGRQTGTQRRAQQTGQSQPAQQAQQKSGLSFKDAIRASQTKPGQDLVKSTQQPVAKPVAKPAPQLSGAQRAQQMAKDRIAAGRNTVTGELKSKPKVRKVASVMDVMDSYDPMENLFDDTVQFLVSEGHAKDKSEAMSIMSESEFIDAFNQELNG